MQQQMGRARTAARTRLPPWCRELVSLAATVAVLLVARASLADHYVVPTGSMQPTVEIGDRVIVDKAAFGWRIPGCDVWLGGIDMPERGAVVVLDPPTPGPVLLKRVVALPGDHVQVRAGRLTLNGQPIPIEPTPEGFREHLGTVHWVDLSYGGRPDFGPASVPEGMLLVLGDNRGNSHDGRSFGFVPLETLRGRVLGAFVRQGTLGWWEF